jgi:hypothetical protein
LTAATGATALGSSFLPQAATAKTATSNNEKRWNMMTMTPNLIII